eukprot:NODE_3_length_80033_cov_0.932970.p20 type:complete len:351 gc:universal NODE_3_length_80033_cov_0.932970:27666-26614(-)
MRRRGEFDESKSKRIKIEDHSSRITIDSKELTRLLCLQLQKMGYISTAKLLQSESGVLMESKEVSKLRNGIIEGDWSSVYNTIDDLKLENGLELKILIHRQELLEQILSGNRLYALQYLRKISFSIGEKYTQQFTRLIMCSNNELYQCYESISNTRCKIMQNLEEHLPCNLVIPQNRLENLLQQSFELQKQNCTYHSDNCQFSLFQDHKCSSEFFPRKVSLQIQGHDSEVWALAWGNKTHYFASGGKDAKIKVWDLAGNCLAVFDDHEESITKIKFSPEDKYLLSGSTDATVKLWDIQVSFTNSEKETYGIFGNTQWRHNWPRMDFNWRLYNVQYQFTSCNVGQTGQNYS